MGIQSTPLTTDATSASVTLTFHPAQNAILEVNYLPLAQLYAHQKPLHRTTLLQPRQSQIRRQSLPQQFTANPLTLHQITANPLTLHQITVLTGQCRLQVTLPVCVSVKT